MEVYLDNAATTPALPQVREIADTLMTEEFGNPSSKHSYGVRAESYIKQAAVSIAETLKCTPKEIIFTSGGTEANNLALIGSCLANKRDGNHIIFSGIEHASVYNPILFLEEMGFRVTILPVDRNGHVSKDALLDAICEDTILISIMYVNNEIGAVEDIEGLCAAAKRKKPSVLFHSDCIQAYGKYLIYPKRIGLDMLSVSGHKLHGPKGSGFLYVGEKVKLKPILYGGGQQKNMRSGTENVPAIAGLGVAVVEQFANRELTLASMQARKQQLMAAMQAIPEVMVNSTSEGAPHIVSVSFPGVRSEVMLNALAERGIYVSSGSACSSNHPGISTTLKAIGVSEKALDATLRFSFSRFTSEKDIDYTIEQCRQLYTLLKKYKRS